MLGQARAPADEEEFGSNMSQEEREMVANFITVVADFLEHRFPTQKNTPTKQRQKVQAAEGIPNNDS